jgi:hypothetical protein
MQLQVALFALQLLEPSLLVDAQFPEFQVEALLFSFSLQLSSMGMQGKVSHF